MAVRKAGAGAIAAAAVAWCGAAAAGPCDEAKNALTIIHYQTAQTDIPPDALPKLEQFASTAKYKDAVCIRGQVDAQGEDDAMNRQIARSRALNVKLFLLSRGVREEVIEVQTQNFGFTLFGLLEKDQRGSRRVTLTHE